MPDVDRFELTEEHVKLLRAARVGWNGDEFGAPSIDPKRPFGNGDVMADMHELLAGEPWPPDPAADAVVLQRSYRALYLELRRALQVALSAGTFQAGIYESPKYRDRWTRADAAVEFTLSCERCRHPAHAPGRCGVNVGTGYAGPVPCRCGVDDG